jgi:phosphoglycolate phosphatase
MPDAPGAPRVLPVDAVLFDLDGTIADTAPDLGAALNRVRADRDLAPVPLAVLRPYPRTARAGSSAPALPSRLASPITYRCATRSCALRGGRVRRDGALRGSRCSARRARREALPWGIVTNKATRFTTPLLEALRLAARAGTIVCGTRPTREAHPAPLAFAAEQLGVAPSRCVYVGDARRDVEAGKAAGMATLVARWGYIQPDETPDAWAADGIVDAPAALLDWLAPVPATSTRSR